MSSYASPSHQSKVLVSNNYVPGNRFKFADHKLAIQVRGKMREHVTNLDKNHNLEFEEDEIRQLLIELLGEDQNEIHYVVKNVFRYDRNNDGSISYDEFINFAVQQHFGQMAIQRLHRQELYSKGSSRIMNSQQFSKTLAYSLDRIRSPGALEVYQQLFREVDLDTDGWISYEDYFYFLREYFGTKSYAASLADIKVQETKDPNFVDGNKETPEERIAKLVYSQLKITIMLQDASKKMRLERPEIERILNQSFGLAGYDREQVIKKILGEQEALTYEHFMKLIIQLYLCEIDINQNYPNLSRIENGSFSVMFCKSLSFVHIKPAEHILAQIFQKTDQNKDGYISVDEYTGMIHRIFGDHVFDLRGIPRAMRQ